MSLVVLFWFDKDIDIDNRTPCIPNSWYKCTENSNLEVRSSMFMKPNVSRKITLSFLLWKSRLVTLLKHDWEWCRSDLIFSFNSVMGGGGWNCYLSICGTECLYWLELCTQNWQVLSFFMFLHQTYSKKHIWYETFTRTKQFWKYFLVLFHFKNITLELKNLQLLFHFELPCIIQMHFILLFNLPVMFLHSENEDWFKFLY